MGDNVWEVVGGQKKKPKGPKVNTNNGQIPGVKWSSVMPSASAPSVPTTKKPKKIKHKGPRDYKVAALPNLESDSDDQSTQLNLLEAVEEYFIMGYAFQFQVLINLVNLVPRRKR